MCRFVAYLGNPLTIDELLLKPTNSLIKQSHDAKEAVEPLNGDGFGLGWYDHDIRTEPAVFRYITPAWSNQNLLYNAPMIRTQCLLGHIRAATEGYVSELNCHPFHYHNYLFMHNGGIDDFPKIKRPLINMLSEEMYLWITGQTDSEHIFALVMENVRKKVPLEEASLYDLLDGFQEAFNQIEGLKLLYGLDDVSTYNMVVSDGKRMLATRFSSHPQIENRTLYYATGREYVCEDGICRIEKDKGEGRAVLIVSEKLTDISEDWTEVPMNHAVLVDTDLIVRLKPMRPVADALAL